MNFYPLFALKHIKYAFISILNNFKMNNNNAKPALNIKLSNKLSISNIMLYNLHNKSYDQCTNYECNKINASDNFWGINEIKLLELNDLIHINSNNIINYLCAFTLLVFVIYNINSNNFKKNKKNMSFIYDLGKKAQFLFFFILKTLLLFITSYILYRSIILLNPSLIGFNFYESHMVINNIDNGSNIIYANDSGETGYEECTCGGNCTCCCGQCVLVEWGVVIFVSIILLDRESFILLPSYSKEFKFNNSKFSDVPLVWGLYFQDGASPSFEGIVDLHNRIMFYLVIILFGVSWIMVSIMWNFNKNRNKLVYRYLNHGTLIELIWTVGPALVLVAIAFPSFKLLYLMDEVIDPAMTVKVTGFFLKFLNIYKSTYKYLKKGGLKSYILCMDVFYNDNKFLKKNKNSFLKLNNFHTLVKAKNRIGPHDKDVISVIIGSLLGDAYGNKRSLEGTRFCYRQSIKHKEYLFWLYRFFNNRGYCSNLEPRIYTRLLNYNNLIKKYYGYEFNTFTFRSFDWIYKMFYKNGKKRIHSNLGSFLTPLALAIWISDDGCWVQSGVRISCNSFTLKEIELLIKIIHQNFGLKSNIQKIYTPNQYSIYIQSKSIPLLKKIIFPYLHGSMFYKLGL